MDQVEVVILEADPEPTIRGVSKANAALDGFERTAIRATEGTRKRFGDLSKSTDSAGVSFENVDGKTSALARKMEVLDRINRQTVGGFDRLREKLSVIGESVAGLYVVDEAFRKISGTVGVATAALIEHQGAASTVLNAYRAIRLALSPTIFTGATLGLGLAAEQVLKLVYARGRLIDQQAEFAAT